MMQRVFGGQVLAQSLVAAVRTVPERFACHSLHSYFLRPGDTKVPIIYDVDTIRDGRSFATRRVAARQHGRPIFFLTAELPDPRGGPRAPGPDAGGALARGLPARRWTGAPRRPTTSGCASGPRSTYDRSRTRAPAARLDARRPPGPLAVVDPGQRRPPGRPGDAAGRVHLRLRHDPAGGRAGAARAVHPVTRACRRPRWTTRSGSTGRSAPTSGGSTTRPRRPPPAVVGSRSPGSSPRTGSSWRRVAQEGLIRLHPDAP